MTEQQIIICMSMNITTRLPVKPELALQAVCKKGKQSYLCSLRLQRLVRRLKRLKQAAPWYINYASYKHKIIHNGINNHSYVLLGQTITAH